MVKIIDSFMFFNELDVLEMRLRYLSDHVDMFVLVESPETHMGKPKPLYFEENKSRFEQWLPKIKHIVADTCSLPNRDEYFVIEQFQRHEIIKGLVDFDPDDLVMISDADEIPCRDSLKSLRPTVAFHMTMFEYSFDTMFEGEPWVGSVLTTVRDVRALGPNYFRYNRWKFPVLQNSGWHLSSFGDAKHVQNKIENYAHAPDEKHKGQTAEDFERYVKEGIHADGQIKLVRTPEHVKATLEPLMCTYQSSHSRQKP